MNIQKSIDNDTVNENNSKLIDHKSVINKNTSNENTSNENKNIEKESKKCMARIWNRGKGGQCSRNKVGNNDFCKQHIECRKHGRIDENIDRNIFVKNSKVLYK